MWIILVLGHPISALKRSKTLRRRPHPRSKNGCVVYKERHVHYDGDDRTGMCLAPPKLGKVGHDSELQACREGHDEAGDIPF